MAQRIRIGLVSGTASKTDLDANYALIERKLNSHRTLDLISFGELFLMSDTNQLNEKTFPERLEKVLEKISDLAIQTDTAISIGHPLYGEDKCFIRQSVFMPDGRIEIYDKVHLGRTEKETFSAGNEVTVFEFKDFIIGIQLCIDTHIPEMTLSQKLKGAEIILAPFNTPYKTTKRITNWKKYIPARGYEYNLAVLCHNSAGGIFAVNGFGEILCENDEVQSIEVIELSKVEDYNHKIDYLSYRRSEVY